MKGLVLMYEKVFVLMEENNCPRQEPLLVSRKKKNLLTYLKEWKYKYNKEGDFFYRKHKKNDCISATNYEDCVRITEAKFLT